MDKPKDPGTKEPKVAPAPPPDVVKSGHEPDKVNIRAVVKFLVALAVIGVLCCFGVWVLLKILEHERSENQVAPSAIASQRQRLPPAPRLQMAPGSQSQLTSGGYSKGPDYEMLEDRQAEEDRLNSYGWVNRNTGIVRIPIDQAMKLIVGRLPSQPSQGGAAPGAQPRPSPGQPGIYLPTASSSGRVAERRKE